MNQLNTNQPWPAEGLESIGRCPICGSFGRTLLHKGLRDRVFFCALGEWVLYRCEGCGSGYLDPRPTPETIGLAYRTYFTHITAFREPITNFSWPRRIKRILADGYRNYRSGSRRRPLDFLGVLAAMLLPSQKAIIDAEWRHLPPCAPGAKLLDIGCGNGEFLELARRAGWQAVGVDLDPKAVECARTRGLDVRQGSVEVLDPEQEQFDGITLSHVIEHVHDPLAVLRACYRLLKPAGWIWLETPNLDALGHSRYGPNWRGLEPPRHLVLFNFASLCQALAAAGFTNIEVLPYRPLCATTFAASEAIAAGKEARQADRLSGEGRLAAAKAERQARRDPDVREFLTVRAYKQIEGPNSAGERK